MKRIAGILILILISLSVFAQRHDGGHDKHERIKALKIGYITDKLDLTAKQSEKFWPVYNEYERKRRDVRRTFFEAYKEKNPTSDKHTAHQYVNDNLDYQQAELDLKKEYKDKLLKVISEQQLAELYQAEHDFKKRLLEELHHRRGSHGDRKK